MVATAGALAFDVDQAQNSPRVSFRDFVCENRDRERERWSTVGPPWSGRVVAEFTSACRRNRLSACDTRLGWVASSARIGSEAIRSSPRPAEIVARWGAALSLEKRSANPEIQGPACSFRVVIYGDHNVTRKRRITKFSWRRLIPGSFERRSSSTRTRQPRCKLQSPE